MQIGGIILCGGQSTRMGMAKAWLPFGGETLLARVARQFTKAVQPVVVAAAADQELPQLSGEIAVCRDRVPGRGPLEGIAVGLGALAGHADAAFLCACDAAMLSPSVVRQMCALLEDHDAIVPVVGGLRQTLLCCCRIHVLSIVDTMIEAGERKTNLLFDRIATRFLDEEELRAIDPALQSVQTMNTPAEYFAALAAAGFPPPDDAILRSLSAATRREP